MKTYKELNVLLSDPKRYYYETAHKIPPPYLDDPLEQRCCLMPYVLSDLKKKLYLKNLSDLIPSLDPLSKMAREAVLEELSDEDEKIKRQLNEHQLEKTDLFSIEVLSNISEPFYREKTWFYPKTLFTGNLAVVSNKGILFNTPREKNYSDFVQLLPPILFLSTIHSPFPTKALLCDGKEFSLHAKDCSDLLNILFEIETVAKKCPLKFFGSKTQDSYSIFQSVSPSIGKEDSYLVEKIDTLLRDLYDRF
jgi:hypothetical protein